MTPGDAPSDPRTQLPPFGSLPVVERVDPVAVRVLAPNPSPMTLDGTNTYVLFEDDGQPAVVVDPGPEDPDHRARVDEVIASHDLEVAVVAVTHRHPDHAAASAAWAADWDVRVAAADPTIAGTDGRVLAGGDEVAAGGLYLHVIETPGHTADSISLRLPTRAVVTGDHVLGRGTAVVAHPDGTLTGYLQSLRRLLDLGPAALLPGHGPVVDQQPEAVLEFYTAHRHHRLQQVIDVLEDGPRTTREVVEVIYADHDPAVWPAATASTLAAFEHLEEQGLVERDGDRARLP